MLNIRRNAAILNIFKNDFKHIEAFVHQHAPFVKQLVMVDTGSSDGSFAVAKRAAEFYTNVTVQSVNFPEVDFAAFRNRCLQIFRAVRHEDVTHYFWVDTDERLHVEKEEVPEADVYVLEREDKSRRFSTRLQRGFSVTADGHWEGLVHEGFIMHPPLPETQVWQLKLLHLESEMERSQEKKLLYFNLINRQLRRYASEGNSDGFRQFVCLAMLMASFDFEEPLLCAELFRRYGDCLGNDQHVTTTELNALIHAVRSLARLGEDAILLGERVMRLHPAKSTVYQVLRGLLLDYRNTAYVRNVYETTYRDLPDNLNTAFYNADFLLPEQVALFERRIRRQEAWLDELRLLPAA